MVAMNDFNVQETQLAKQKEIHDILPLSTAYAQTAPGW
jgi:hypothetical protein